VLEVRGLGFTHNFITFSFYPFCEIDELNLIFVNSCMIVVVMFENMMYMIIACLYVN
jgi:hypothetical protein